MDISQVVSLSLWMDQTFGELQGPFSTLISVLHTNSQQSSKVPVTPAFEELKDRLSSVDLAGLSSIQKEVLSQRGILSLFGNSGVRWLDDLIKQQAYDPVTAHQEVQNQFSRLDQVARLLSEFGASASSIGFKPSAKEDGIYFSIIFRDEASIVNIRDWKSSASDWEFILSSVAELAGVRAEEVKVRGVQNGSVILTLASAVGVTRILATMSKHLAAISNDYLDFQLKREELRRLRMMSEVIERDLKRQETERLQSRKSEIIEAVRPIAVNADQEKLNKLDKALDRYIAFTEKGGLIDYVFPEADLDSEEEIDVDIESLVATIKDFRQESERRALLENRTE